MRRRPHRPQHERPVQLPGHGRVRAESLELVAEARGGGQAHQVAVAPRFERRRRRRRSERSVGRVLVVVVRVVVGPERGEERRRWFVPVGLHEPGLGALRDPESEGGRHAGAYLRRGDRQRQRADAAHREARRRRDRRAASSPARSQPSGRPRARRGVSRAVPLLLLLVLVVIIARVCDVDRDGTVRRRARAHRRAGRVEVGALRARQSERRMGPRAIVGIPRGIPRRGGALGVRIVRVGASAGRGLGRGSKLRRGERADPRGGVVVVAHAACGSRVRPVTTSRKQSRNGKSRRFPNQFAVNSRPKNWNSQIPNAA